MHVQVLSEDGEVNFGLIRKLSFPEITIILENN